MVFPCQEIGSSTTLLDDIKRLRSIEAFMDMVFVCGSQEEEIPACRMLVASRSPVLQSMLLTSGMSESPRTHVPLPHVDPAVMRICLEFFHTDTVQDSSWSNISMATHVLEAGMFFLIERLQCLAFASLVCSLKLASNERAEWWPSLVSSYNFAIELGPKHACHNEFLRQFQKIAKRHLAGCNNVFSGSDYERHFYKGLTEPPLFWFIWSDTWSNAPRSGMPHYVAFLHVVRWSAYRALIKKPSIDEGEFREVLNKCLPQSSQVLRTMLSSEPVDVSFNDSDISRCMKLLAGPLLDCLKRAPIDFARMPSHILCKLIEPLGILSPSALLAAYRHQALRRPDLQWDMHAHGTHYKVREVAPTIISCCSLKTLPKESRLRGFARCNTYLDTDTEISLDWVIFIEKPCAEFRIGFCNTSCSTDFDCVLGDTEWSWALDANGFLHHEKEKSPYVKEGVKEGVTVQVHLDVGNRSCSFCIDNKDAGVAWTDLGLNMYPVYPAISFVEPGEFKIRRVHYKSIDRLPKPMCLTADAPCGEDAAEVA